MRLIPHALTFFRLLAAPSLAWLVVHLRYPEAMMLVAVAGITDWLDGYTARRLGVTGKLGVILDPLADKIMLVTLFFALAYAAVIPAWVVVLVMARDVVIVSGALLLRMFRNVRTFLPSILGKISTFFQIVFVVMALLDAAVHLAFVRWLRFLALLLTAFFTTLSWLDYVNRGTRMAKGGFQFTAAASPRE
ncbi:MAG: CDP-alcohol phosphatidyltransferase family protein [Acidobacteriaceae bacterium]|nr:CDP-alcohol phosphatidyltransferase family protein [Acidobacteriaceae bacterium]